MNLDELEALAKAATPGPWMRLFGERTVYDRLNDGCRGNAIVRTDIHPPLGKDIDNLDFIAAANPETILALIALLREMGEELHWFLHEANNRGSEGPPRVWRLLTKYKEMTNEH